MQFKFEESRQFKTQVNWAHFITGVTFGYLAYSSFEAVSDVNNILSELEELDNSTDFWDAQEAEYKSRKDRLVAEGILYSLASIINLSYSFEKVEISISASNAEVSYKF